jgi:hypothetical protein
MVWTRVGVAGFLLLPLSAPASAQDGSRPGSRPASTPAAPARYVLVPRTAAEKAGGTNNAFPFSANPPMRYQTFLAPEAFAEHEPGPLAIAGLGFRCLGRSPVGFERRRVELEIRIGTLPGAGNLHDVSPRFGDNLGADALVVFARGHVEMGPAPERLKAPKALDVWDLEIPFERSFTYRRDRVLVIEVRVFGNDAQAGSFTFPLDSHREAFAARLWGSPEAEEGKLQSASGLVMRMLLKPRPESRPGTRADR